MLTKCICILLILAVAQAFPSPDVKPTNDELTCPQKIAWYMGISEKINSMVSQYQSISRFDLLTSLTADAVSKLTVDETNFFNSTRSFALKISTGSDISIYTRNAASEQSACNIDRYRTATSELTQSAIVFKSNVSSVIDHSQLPNETKDNYNEALAKIVNFLIEINMTENAFKDLESLAKEAETKATQGIQLDKQYEISENGVEKITESAAPQESREEDKGFDEKFKNAKIINTYNQLPTRVKPGPILLDAVADGGKHLADFRIIIVVLVVIFITVCGMYVWIWHREQISLRYTRMP